jgi:iron(III) transport system substrate-binding protein
MHSAIAFFAPHDPGYVVDVSGAAVLKSSHHQADAERFLAFLVSPQGQEIIANTDSYEYPLDTSIPAAGGQVPFASLQPDPITIAQLGDGATAVALLQQAQLI